MLIQEAQREMRATFLGGFAGQGVSGLIWLLSAALSTWGTVRSSSYLCTRARKDLKVRTRVLCRSSPPFSEDLQDPSSRCALRTFRTSLLRRAASHRSVLRSRR